MKISGPIQIFETYDEAIDFLYKHIKTYDLSYISEERKKDILHDASGSVHLDILLRHTDWASSDIRNECDRQVGWNLLRYMEWKAKNPGEDPKENLGEPNGT